MHAGAAAQERPVNERDVRTPIAQRGGLCRARDASDFVALLESEQRFDARSDHRVRDDQQQLDLFQPRYSTPRWALRGPLDRCIPRASDQAVGVLSTLSGITTRLSYQTHTKV